MIGYSELDHRDSSLLQYNVEKVYYKVNHLMLFNKDARKNLDIYIGINNEITMEQVYTGIEARIALIKSSASTVEEMHSKGEEQFSKLQDKDNVLLICFVEIKFVTIF